MHNPIVRELPVHFLQVTRYLLLLLPVSDFLLLAEQLEQFYARPRQHDDTHPLTGVRPPCTDHN